MKAITDSAKKDGSFIFRKIIQVLITDHATWSQSTSSRDMLQSHGSQIGAAYKIVHEARKDFNLSMCIKILCQIIVESRRMLRKKFDETMNITTGNDEAEKRDVTKERCVNEVEHLDHNNREEGKEVEEDENIEYSNDKDEEIPPNT